MDVSELQWITYLSLAALAIVTYLYLRQRNEINQRAQTHIPQDDFYSVASKPAGLMNKSFPGAGANLPTFSPREGFQRKNPGEMNTSHIIPRDTRDFSGFGDGTGSRFNRTPADLTQTKAADKSFDEYRKYVPYEPSQEISTSKGLYKQDPTDRNKPNWSKPETSLTQISTQLDPYDANKDILYAQTQPQVEEDVPTTGDRWNNTRPLDVPDLENEYKVFKDFKLREGRSFHDEVKRDESPLRPNSKKLTGLDRVGHSPDSPFKMFGSPAVGTNSKKKQGATTKQQQNLLSKKDSFTRTQEALNQKAKPPGRTVVPHNQRSAKVLADQRNERKTRLNQVFIDNNSEDEMHVEEQRDPTTKNKRPATNTRSFDNYGKELSNKKVLKTNDQQAKTKPFERKDIPIKNYQIDVYSKKEQKPPVNKQSSVDLSYMSEYSANPSLKRYVQMKTRQDETTKASKPSTPITHSKSMNVEKSPRQAVSPKVEKGSYRAPSSLLGRKEDTSTGSKKLTSNGSHKISTSESKQEKSPIQKSDVDENKGLFSNSNGNKLSSLPKDTSIKPEGAKISSIIGGSSLFTQPKPSETTPLGDVETKAPKLNETEKAPAQAPMGQGNAFSLFKTIRSGGSGPPVKESAEQPQVEAAPAQKKEEEPKKQSTLFSNTTTSDKKIEDEKPAKSLLSNSSSGGLFSNLTQIPSAAENKPESTGLFGKSFGNKETKDAEPKPASSSLGLGAATKSSDKEEEKPKTGLFGSLPTPAGGSGSLFGNLNSEPKKESNQPAFSGLFGNANKDADKQKEVPKKDDPLAAYSKQPEGADDTKPKGLFTNSGSSFSSLFKNPSSNQDNSGSGKVGGSLFGGLSSGGGLFSNLNNANQPKE